MNTSRTPDALAEPRRMHRPPAVRRRRHQQVRAADGPVSTRNTGPGPLASEIVTVTTREPALAAWVEAIPEHTFIPSATSAKRHRDSSTILIRPIDSSDRALMAEGFARLSPRSRELRFLGAKPSLSPTELDHLTKVDHREREAFVALSSADGRGIGVARYARSSIDPASAEVAIAVIDDWHRRGVSAELITRLLERAREEGIRRFTAVISNDNTASLHLMHSLDLDVAILDRDHEATEYEIRLDNAGPPARVRHRRSGS